jgi:hypothetical protein
MNNILLEKGNIRIEVYEEKERLSEKYWAKKVDGTWEIVASDFEGSSIGSLYMEGADGKPLQGSLDNIYVKDDVIIIELIVAGQKVTRNIIIEDGEEGRIKVSSKFEPSDCPELHGFYDKYNFKQEQFWSYAPSVKGFIPDAQYKAPLVMLQLIETAFGIVPDVTVLNKSVIKRCNHAMKLDIREGENLSVGYIPGHMLVHAVYCEDLKRTWKPET